jgi:hypothetical protein
VSGVRFPLSGLLAAATVGECGWADLTEPIFVRAGEALIAVPEGS